jgi:hypothetical protein
MTPTAPTVLCALAALVATTAIGCGEPSGGVPVSGHVSYRGEAIASGSVTFFPVKGRPSSSVLSPSGEYRLNLPPGEYDVAISVGVELPAGWKEGDPVPAQKIVLPAEYTTRARSPLTATVSADQDQPIDFELN